MPHLKRLLGPGHAPNIADCMYRMYPVHAAASYISPCHTTRVHSSRRIRPWKNAAGPLDARRRSSFRPQLSDSPLFSHRASRPLSLALPNAAPPGCVRRGTRLPSADKIAHSTETLLRFSWSPCRRVFSSSISLILPIVFRRGTALDDTASADLCCCSCFSFPRLKARWRWRGRLARAGSDGWTAERRDDLRFCLDGAIDSVFR